VTTLPRILLLGADEPEALPPDVLEGLGSRCELVPWSVEWGAADWSSRGDFRGVLLCGTASRQATGWVVLETVLKHLPEGVAVIDNEYRIRWCNERLTAMVGRPNLTGMVFFEAFGSPETVGPAFTPFDTTLSCDTQCSTTLRVGEKTYYELIGAPVHGNVDGFARVAVVTVRDVSADMLVRQKLNAIYRAGLELGELSAEDLVELTVDERIELLKQKIVQFTKDVLEFETVEIRLLDERTKELEPLLQVGISEEATRRRLYADPVGNGLTGYVAATGRSYLCEDTLKDGKYLPGALNARSSLTVPLILHEQVLGTFNVESLSPGWFTANDQQFLELFCREVAIALNTLELLAAEKISAATESTELILKEIAQPIDEMINDIAWVLDCYIGHDPSVCERLQRVLKHTRGVRQLVHRVGEKMMPRHPNPPLPLRPQRPKLRGKRVLVVDNDEAVRLAAHELLGRFGCEVETAHHGDEALLMTRTFHYDAVIVDIRLPDMTGYDCFVQLRQVNEHLPVILMTGFGYDPAHSIVKARQMGLKSVLYKPFRLEQLLQHVETAVAGATDGPLAGG
jgi:two-component system, sensor histidine kinase SagS